MGTLDASRVACAAVVVDWKPRGVRDMLAFTSSNFIGLMEDGCSVLKYPYYPNDRESINALQEEAYRYRYLGRHEHLVTFKDMSDDGLVLEYCEKGALCDVVDSLNEGQKIAIGEQIARGLVHLHTRNYIHGDLNTQNVFVTSSWIAKIGDLQGQLSDSDGNVKIPAKAENNAKSRLPGPGPDDDFSTQTDIFAFGTLLYHLWFGHPPYPELDALRDGDEIQARYSRGQFPIDAHAVGLEKVIWRCWNSTYASASEILEDISSLGHLEPKGSTASNNTPLPPFPLPPPPPHRVLPPSSSPSYTSTSSPTTSSSPPPRRSPATSTSSQQPSSPSQTPWQKLPSSYRRHTSRTSPSLQIANYQASQTTSQQPSNSSPTFASSTLGTDTSLSGTSATPLR